MACQTFSHLRGTPGGTAKVVALVQDNPKASDPAFRAPGAKILQSWRDAVQDPEVDPIDICLLLPKLALGYNDSRIIEATEVIRSITTGQAMWPTFEARHHTCRIVDACRESSHLGAWVSIA